MTNKRSEFMAELKAINPLYDSVALERKLLQTLGREANCPHLGMCARIVLLCNSIQGADKHLPGSRVNNGSSKRTRKSRAEGSRRRVFTPGIFIISNKPSANDSSGVPASQTRRLPTCTNATWRSVLAWINCLLKTSCLFFPRPPSPVCKPGPTTATPADGCFATRRPSVLRAFLWSQFPAPVAACRSLPRVNPTAH